MKETKDDHNVSSELMLENKIFEEFCNHRILKSEVDLIEKNLDRFMLEYYKNIGGLIEKIEYIDSVLEANEIKVNTKSDVPKLLDKNLQENKSRLKNKSDKKSHVRNSIKNEIVHANDDLEEKFINSQMNDEDDDNAFNKEINRIYRSVVKYCHPDSHDADPDAKEAFSMLHNSYKNKDLKTLLTLEKIFIENRVLDKIPSSMKDKKQRLSILESQYSKIKHDNHTLKNKKKLLRASDLFLLQRRMRWASMCGQDMIAEIKSSAENELTKKISAIEKMGIEIQSIDKIING